MGDQFTPGPLPDADPGHWSTPQGREMAERYATMTRDQLCGGRMTDMEAANHVAMTSRDDLDFEGRLAVAKDRIRWLSVQLYMAIARAALTKASTHTEGG